MYRSRIPENVRGSAEYEVRFELPCPWRDIVRGFISAECEVFGRGYSHDLFSLRLADTRKLFSEGPTFRVRILGLPRREAKPRANESIIASVDTHRGSRWASINRRQISHGRGTNGERRGEKRRSTSWRSRRHWSFPMKQRQPETVRDCRDYGWYDRHFSSLASVLVA